MQAGGRRFDPVNLHHYLVVVCGENPHQSLMVLMLAFADMFFKNLEEVKKVILVEARMGNHLSGDGKTKWVFDCIKLV